MIARIPYYLLPLFNINDIIKRATEEIVQFAAPELVNQISFSSMFITIVLGIITILFFVWYISFTRNPSAGTSKLCVIV